MINPAACRVIVLRSSPTSTTIWPGHLAIGAFKVLSCVIPGWSTLFAKLDNTVAGCESKETIQWTHDLRASFYKAQTALSTAHTISLPIPSDQLWIVTDRVLRKPGFGATLYVTCNDKLRLAGFFSAKLPCEVEALAIAVATKHFSRTC